MISYLRRSEFKALTFALLPLLNNKFSSSIRKCDMVGTSGSNQDTAWITFGGYCTSLQNLKKCCKQGISVNLQSYGKRAGQTDILSP